jgi:hypothetical protein
MGFEQAEPGFLQLAVLVRATQATLGRQDGLQAGASPVIPHTQHAIGEGAACRAVLVGEVDLSVAVLARCRKVRPGEREIPSD